ncbi:hypothetical protein L596_022119 [Steinernema carpocapsae]|uniref:Uncharacterized protein n=1 Tax=Steinernema carpocapsae TaxID=34508 RepID=A0A4U5MKU2_STECR|nr:hypothetical protein L596_022119 [Steinernema carpocapsae]
MPTEGAGSRRPATYDCLRDSLLHCHAHLHLLHHPHPVLREAGRHAKAAKSGAREPRPAEGGQGEGEDGRRRRDHGVDRMFHGQHRRQQFHDHAIVIREGRRRSEEKPRTF